MSQITPYNSGSTASTAVPFSRQSREISRITQGAELAVIRTAAQAHVETAKLDAIDHIAGRGMQGVAMVSQLEQQLSGLVPMATTRLQAIGDMHALATAQELASFTRRMA